MTDDTHVEKLFEILIQGDRPAARAYTRKLLADRYTGEEVLTEVFWPTYALIDRLYRSDQLTRLSHHFATRLLRVLVDQLAAQTLQNTTPNGKTVAAFCGPTECEELGAQMAVDLLEAQGFTVNFAGGGIAGDEILALVNDTKPDILLMFCSAAADLPDIRRMIDSIHEVAACPGIQIAVGAGVFNRAEGLAEEIGADVWASDPLEMVQTLIEESDRRAHAEQRTVGRNRRRRNPAA